MAAFVLRRLGGMVVVLFVVSVFTFVLFIEVPGGDPAVRLAGRTATAQNIQNIRRQWGFNRSVVVQYAQMMDRMFITDELISYQDQTNVRQQIIRGIPVTLSVAIGGALIWLLLGAGVGVASALWAGRAADRLLTALALAGLAIPAFWLGLEALNLLGERAGLVPDGGYVGLLQSPTGWAAHLVLPWFVLAFGFVGVYGRVLRTNVLEVLGNDYVRTARAKGLTSRRTVVHHVLRNALIPIVSLFGLDFAGVLGGGTILIEKIFDLHGVGEYAANAVGNLDLPALMGVTMYAAVIVVVVNAVVDIGYAWLDPRIRS